MTTAPSRVYLNRADAGTSIEFTVNAHGGRVADATEVTQAVAAVAERPGPVHSRLKRGQIPVIFDDDHVLETVEEYRFWEAPPSSAGWS